MTAVPADAAPRLARPLRDGCQLTEYRAGDGPALVRGLHDPRVHLDTGTIPFPYLESDAAAFLARVQASAGYLGLPTSFAIRSPAGEVWGGCGVHGLEQGARPRSMAAGSEAAAAHQAELGYWLASSARGRGLMGPAVSCVLRICFEDWGLRKVNARVLVGNVASARVLARAGFMKEGCLREDYFKNGRVRDVNVYGLLRREWRP